MANQQPTTPPPAAPKPDNSKQRLITIAAVVIVALLAVNAWLLFKYTQANKSQMALSTQLDESIAAQEELNLEFTAAREELESLRTGNEELNALIDQKTAELEEAKNRISGMIRKGGSLDAARREIADLKAQLSSSLAEVNQLREQNALLADENTQLTEQRNNLQTDLNTQLEANEGLTQERAILVSEREQLTEANSQLSRKVTQASAIKVNSLTAVGQKVRKSGKPVTRRSADNVSQIAVTFNTDSNEIAEPGEETFFVRILNAEGVTQSAGTGSGVFTNKATGEQIKYTLMNKLDYDRSANSLQLVWKSDQGFSPGRYDVEVYNKGFLVGTTNLVLK
ncbi:MAG: hypothetical protein AAGJ82_13400 [Bacteroidota bacterium]